MRGSGGRVALVIVSVLIIAAVLPVGAAMDFADPAFRTTWAAGEAVTPNFWGPLGTAKEGRMEEYRYSGTNRTRLVQYFDKGRMERYDGVTDKPGTKVTSGLLATELITGRLQIADDEFTAKTPPAIPIAGDANGKGPTYATLAASSLIKPQADAGKEVGISNTLLPDGTVGLGMAEANPQTRLIAFDAPTKHNVSRAFAEYRTKVGLTTIGYAISEPFFAEFTVGGAAKSVLVQAFERRVLTYTASNQSAFQVEMGNIGQHYYRWRYESSDAAPTATAASTTAPSSTATRTATPATSVTTTTVAAALGTVPPRANYNCLTFSSQAAAQAYLRMYPEDTSDIDRERDGIACESNAGPYDRMVVPRPRPGAQNVCPSGYPVKVIPGTKTYLLPGQTKYMDTSADICFKNPNEIEMIGYTKAP